MPRKLKEPVRQQAILTKLRDGIVRGAFPPGARLSTRLQLAEEFDTTVITVQRALTKLSQEGFVTASGSRGTFVSENPPHLSHYGLVFGYRPEFADTPWVGIARAMREAAFAMQRAQTRRLSIYFYTGFEFHRTDDYERLVDGVINRTIAGLIFVESPHRMSKTPVLQAPGIPRIALMSEDSIAGIDAISADYRVFYDRALDYLCARGRRRVAIISQSQPEEMFEYVRAGVIRRGMEMRPYAWIASHDPHGDWARNATHALLHDEQHRRPDALILGEDVLVESGCAGIAASGAAVGLDLDVVGHCNYPTPPAKLLPIRLLGFDCAELLNESIRHIDRARRGESQPTLTHMPALFEDEVAANKKELASHSGASLATHSMSV